MNNSQEYIRIFLSSFLFAFLGGFILRRIIDLSRSLINYRDLVNVSTDLSDSDTRGYYGHLPGTTCQCYPFDQFVNAYNQTELDVMRDKDIYYNSLHHVYIAPKYICINGEIVVPATHADYEKIKKYIKKNMIICHDLNNEVKNHDTGYIKNFYFYLHKLYTSKYFSEHVKDIIAFSYLPQKFGPAPFIHYDEKTKTIFTYKIEIDLMVQLILLSFFKILKERNEEIPTILDSDKRIEYERLITNDINNFIKTNNILDSETYFIVSNENIISEVLWNLLVCVDYNLYKSTGLKKVFQNWRFINYATSLFKSIPIKVEFEYEEIFGEDIKTALKADKSLL